MLESYYEGQDKVFKLHGKLHARIILYKQNYIKHIKSEHPEISMRKIIMILEEPDYIYRKSRSSKDYYYERKLGNSNYRVVIVQHKPHVKKVITAYKLDCIKEFDRKHIYCIYDKNSFVTYEELKAEQEGDLDYFIELFKEH